jgi:MFS family permease
MHLGLRLFLPFAAGYFLSYLLRNVNAVIAPELVGELGVSAADLGLLTSAYLLAFGTFQLPLGVLLDRYGPRRVEVALLLIAAAGTAAFGLGTSLGELALARAAIGLGVSACLMAAFKAFAVWYPVERLPALNGAAMVAADGTMAVIVGGDRAEAACPVAGTITGLRSGGTLNVRTEPNTTHARLDALRNGQRVFVCDGSLDEQWLGVVYPAAAGQECGVGAPRDPAMPYSGPCRSGWVNAGWVTRDAPARN